MAWFIYQHAALTGRNESNSETWCFRRQNEQWIGLDWILKNGPTDITDLDLSSCFNNAMPRLAMLAKWLHLDCSCWLADALDFIGPQYWPPNGIRTLCPLYSGCGRTLGLLCAWNRVAALVSLFLFCAFANFRSVHSAVAPGESRFRLHYNEALVMGINAKLRRDINSPYFSTCLLLIQLVWVAVDLTSYHSLHRVDIKSHDPPNSPDLNPVDYAIWGILQ